MMTSRMSTTLAARRAARWGHLYLDLLWRSRNSCPPANQEPMEALVAHEMMAPRRGRNGESAMNHSLQFHAGGQWIQNTKAGLVKANMHHPCKLKAHKRSCAHQVVKGNPAPKEKVGDLFDRARMAGAEDGPSAPVPVQRSSTAFSGTARTLAGGDVAPAPGPAQAGGQPQRIVHNISFYANGVFTVDDGASLASLLSFYTFAPLQLESQLGYTPGVLTIKITLRQHASLPSEWWDTFCLICTQPECRS